MRSTTGRTLSWRASRRQSRTPTRLTPSAAPVSLISGSGWHSPGSSHPRPFNRGREWLGTVFNNWKIAGIATYGSGRPVNATITGDANQDGNNTNDRLPGVRRNSFTGPDYATTDLRVTRRIYAGDRLKMELVGESFNLLNRDNRRVLITEDGFQSNSASFVQTDKRIGINYFPAQYRVPNNFLHATNAYAPRQMQLALKLIY